MRADDYNARALERGDLTVQDISVLTREFQAERGLKVDGMAGPVTLEVLRSGVTQPPVFPGIGEPADQAPGGIGFDGPLVRIPRSRREIIEVAGNPGAGKVDRTWKRRNIVSLRGLPGLPSWRWVSIHRLAEPYLREALRRARELGSQTTITRCGGFVFRHVQHDPSRPLSLHAYGWAVDLNPPTNRSRRFERGEAPEPFSPEWRGFWPEAGAVDEPLVKAFESVGWTWGGVWGRRGYSLSQRARNVSLVDPMHFELRDLA